MLLLLSCMQDLELGRHIGSGSFSNVFLGKWRNQTVAVKVWLEPAGTRPSKMLSVAYDGNIGQDSLSRCCSIDPLPCCIPQVCDSGISASEGRSLKPWSSVEAQQSRALDHPHLVTTLVRTHLSDCVEQAHTGEDCDKHTLAVHCRRTPQCSFPLRHQSQ